MSSSGLFRSMRGRNSGEKVEKSVKITANGDRLLGSAERAVKDFIIQEERGMRLSDNDSDLAPGVDNVIEVEGVSAE